MIHLRYSGASMRPQYGSYLAHSQSYSHIWKKQAKLVTLRPYLVLGLVSAMFDSDRGKSSSYSQNLARLIHPKRQEGLGKADVISKTNPFLLLDQTPHYLLDQVKD